MAKVLTKEQARNVLRAMEALVNLGGFVSEIKIAGNVTFICYVSGGYSLSLNGRTTESFDTLAEFASFYNITWM